MIGGGDGSVPDGNPILVLLAFFIGWGLAIVTVHIAPYMLSSTTKHQKDAPSKITLPIIILCILIIGGVATLIVLGGLQIDAIKQDKEYGRALLVAAFIQVIFSLVYQWSVLKEKLA